MTDIVLVRHGETIWHAENRYSGSSDIPLTDHGREQAEELARWARTAGLAAMWSSDMRRTLQTAQPSVEATGLDLHVDPRLREVDFGDAEGMTHTEMSETIPEEFAAFQRDPAANHLPGGEDPRLAAERGLECLAEIAETHPGGRVLVVCHGTLIRIMMCSMLDIPLSEYRRLFPAIRNAHLNEIGRTGGGIALLTWNAPPVQAKEPR